MSKEAENIFSWRKQLIGMTPQQRVDFYYKELRKGYQQSVLEAELARQNARKQMIPTIEIFKRFLRYGL